MDVILEVATDNDDKFMRADRAQLQDIAEQAALPSADLERCAKAFWKIASPVALHSSSDAEFELVLDGREDGESWKELLAALKEAV